LAVNKDKLLESAQKNLKKKQIAKAIKDYQKVVEIDPGDVRSRQKLAELLVRSNRNTDAYEQYESVAKYFSSNGFYLKAIAIYKQMQRLDSSQVSIYNRLAELNEKQGLVGNAMSEYRTLVNYYERNGMVADAIKTLEKMRDLDASNLNVRVKLAEVYATSDRQDEGLVEFEGILASLSERNDFDKILRLYKMFLPLFPNNKKLQMGLALTLYEKGELEQGITILNGLLKDNPDNPDILRLLARGYNDSQDWVCAKQTYQQLLEMDPSDLDTREGLIKCHLDSQTPEPALAELEDWKDSFFKADRLEQLKNYYERLKNELPQNKTVLQTLDSIYELTGEGDKLLDIMSEKENEPEEVIIDETLSDSLLGSVDQDIEAPVLDLDIDTGDEEELVLEVAAEEDDDLLLEPVEDEEEIFELNINAGNDLESADEDLEFSFDISEDKTAQAASAAAGQRDIRADLEEAEFYIQQGLYDEADKLCRDILAYAPDSVECQLKLDEISTYLQKEAAGTVSEQKDLDSEVMTDGFPDFEDTDFSPTLEEKSGQKVFRTDVDEQIAADDMESHYNLGIAYREMGLLDDAISEFDKAAKDPSRFVDCQMLKALCYADREDFPNAELMLQQALESENLDSAQRLNLGYELGLLYERCERSEDALASFQSIASQDDSYRDVRDKVTLLCEKLGISDADQLGGLTDNKERISFL